MAMSTQTYINRQSDRSEGTLILHLII